MQQQIGVSRLLQGGGKRVHQAVRQVADEADGVRQRHRAGSVAEVQLPCRGVQRRKQLVGRIGTRLDEGVEQRGLAGVGVADQGNREGVAPLALAPLGLALLLDLGQALFGALDGFANHAFVELDLFLARTAANASAAGLPLQVRPAPDQTR